MGIVAKFNRVIIPELKRPILYLIGLSAICVLILLFRVYLTRSIFYLFLGWNLILAWIPYLISIQLLKSRDQKVQLKHSIILMLWLFFLPNAPYILTDLFHLRYSSDFPIWYDTMLIFCFAWTGLMLGLLSLKNIHILFENNYGKIIGWTIVIIVLFLCGYGIYIGRFLRWNSWDIVLNPITLMKDIWLNFVNYHYGIMGMVSLYALVLLLLYVNIKFSFTGNIKQNLTSNKE